MLCPQTSEQRINDCRCKQNCYGGLLPPPFTWMQLCKFTREGVVECFFTQMWTKRLQNGFKFQDIFTEWTRSNCFNIYRLLLLLFDCRTAMGPTFFHTVVDFLALTRDHHSLANKTTGTASFITGRMENVHSVFRAHRVVDGCVTGAGNAQIPLFKLMDQKVILPV